MPDHPAFSGAKIALICEGMLLSYQRDNKPGIPWPGLWDLPGGGREGSETPLECALRETWEEFGLNVDADSIIWTRVHPGQGLEGLDTWFFVAEVAPGAFAKITFGDEGQRWAITTIETFLSKPDAIGHLQRGLRNFY